MELNFNVMKASIIVTLVLMSFGLSNSVLAQSAEVEQLLLNVEKLTQFKQILTDMKKGYEVISSGYNTVKDISQGNFSLHKTFLDGLMQVSPAVKKYRKVAAIVSMEVQLVNDYKSALKRFTADQNFNSNELTYIGSVYDNLVKKSLQNIDDLTTIITANKLRMNDDERLKAIDNIYADMQTKLSFLQNFNNQTSVLSVQRKKQRNDASSVGGIYGNK